MTTSPVSLQTKTLRKVRPNSDAETDAAWNTLLARTDGISGAPRVSAQGSVQNDAHVDTIESSYVAGLDGLRMYPEEQRQIPLLQQLTAPFAEVKGGFDERAATYTPPFFTYRRTEIPWQEVQEGALRDLAQRIATTRPGVTDGESALLRYTDLGLVANAMTGAELSLLRELEEEYFAVQPSKPEGASSTLPAYSNPQTGVVVDLQRGSYRASTYLSLATVSVTVQAPPGSKVLLHRVYGRLDADSVAEVDASGRVDVRLPPFEQPNSSNDPVNFNSSMLQVQVVVPDAGSPSGARVLDRVALQLPSTQQLRDASSIRTALRTNVPPKAADLHELVESVYLSELNRLSDPGGNASWVAYAEQLRSGGKNDDEIRTDLVRQFRSSPEYTQGSRRERTVSLENLVESVYRSELSRPSDPGGKAGHVARLQALQSSPGPTAIIDDGELRSHLVRIFRESAEFQARTG